MVDWSNYGKVIKLYKGTGSLCLAVQKIPCDFELVQMSNGNLYALCHVFETVLLLNLLKKEPIKLVGKTGDGKLIKFYQNIRTRTIKDNEVIIYGTFATIGAEIRKEFNHLKFALSNLTLDTDIELNVGGLDINIKLVNDYTDIIDALKATKDVAITGNAIVKIEANASKDNIIRVIDDLCLLLTLAFGNRVTWLYYEVTEPNGETLENFHRSAITKPFVNLPLVALKSPLEVKEFIENVFPVLLAQKEYWELRKSADAYTDAKVEGDFLEARALKLVILIEHLKSRYLSQENKEFILIPTEKFNVIVNDLIKLVRQLLAFKFSDEESSKIEMMANHVRGLNWYPFGRALSEICKKIGLKLDNKERQRFLDIRNEIVHRFKFHPEHGSTWEQFAFLMTFIGRIFLAILRYDGYYYDWEKLGEIEERMRTKLNLIR